MIVILVLFLILLYLVFFKKSENFEQIWWNVSPSTRNMSYDLRCEPIIPKRNYAFYGSSIEPLVRPKCLEMRS